MDNMVVGLSLTIAEVYGIIKEFFKTISFTSYS